MNSFVNNISSSLDEFVSCLSFIKGSQLDELNKINKIIIESIKDGKKIFWCGNGGSASMASHLSAELLGRFKQKNRAPISSISLSSDLSIITAVANDFGYEQVFSRQVLGLGSPGDVLISLSTSGESENIINAINISNKIKIHTVSFLGKTGGICKSVSDYSLIVPSQDTALIQEIHLVIGHLICNEIDLEFSK